MKEQAKDAKHDLRVEKIQAHTSAVGSDIKEQIIKESTEQNKKLDRILANQGASSSTDMTTPEGRALVKKRALADMQAVRRAEKKAKKEAKKEDGLFKGDEVTYQGRQYIVDESFYGLYEAKQGKAKQYRLLLLEDVERFNASLKAATAGTGSRLDVKEKYTHVVIIGKAEFDLIVADAFKEGFPVQTKRSLDAIPEGWTGKVASKVGNRGASENCVKVHFSLEGGKRSRRFRPRTS